MNTKQPRDFFRGALKFSTDTPDNELKEKSEEIAAAEGLNDDDVFNELRQRRDLIHNSIPPHRDRRFQF